MLLKLINYYGIHSQWIHTRTQQVALVALDGQNADPLFIQEFLGGWSLASWCFLAYKRYQRTQFIRVIAKTIKFGIQNHIRGCMLFNSNIARISYMDGHYSGNWDLAYPCALQESYYQLSSTIKLRQLVSRCIQSTFLSYCIRQQAFVALTHKWHNCKSKIIERNLHSKK